MCAPAIIPILTAVGGIATAASQLGLLGGRQRQQIATPQRQQTAPRREMRPPSGVDHIINNIENDSSESSDSDSSSLGSLDNETIRNISVLSNTKGAKHLNLG